MQHLNILEELMQAEAHGPRIRVRLWFEYPSAAEGDEYKASHLPVSSWCTCCVDGKMSGHMHRCCSSDRDVPQMQIDYFFTNCRVSDCMSSNVWARVAETCETRDESPSVNLGRGNQGETIRARVGRL